jgi:multiple sugar transport system substrate-binding protein
MSPISRKMTAMIAVIIVVVAAIAGTASYFAFFNTPTTPKTTLNMWIHTFAPAVKLFQNLTAEFEALHPDVQVVVTDTAFRDYEKKLSVAFAGGSGPDCFWLGDWGFRNFFDSGVMAPVNYTAMGYATQDDFINERFWPGALDAFMVNGTMYSGGISEYDTIVILYNKVSFDRAGVPYPAENVSLTWDQFAQLGKQLTLYDTNEQMTQMGWGFVYDARYGTSVLEPLVQQLGGEIYDPTANGPTNLTAWQELAQYVYDVGKFGKYGFDDPAFTVAPNPQNDLFTGRVAMAFMNPSGYASALSVNPNFTGGFMPLPHFEGRPPSTAKYSYSYFVNSAADAKKQELAWQWIEFITNDANTLRWYNEVGFVEPRNVTGYTDYLVQQHEWINLFLDGFSIGRYSFRSPYYYAIVDNVPKFLQLLQVANTNPNTAVNITWNWLKAAAATGVG